MQCPECKQDKSYVHTTRHYTETTVRFRKCVNCGHKFKTTESVTDLKPEKLLEAQQKSYI